MRSITNSQIARYKKAYEEDKNARTLTAVMAKTDMAELSYRPIEAARLNGGFSVEVKTHGITSQQQSGRCWSYACMNIMREIVMKNCNLKEFELSGNYLAFWDKFEKCNNYLEMVLENVDLSLDDRTMEYILQGVGDGGYWEMEVDLVNKYGMVPGDVMPDTYQACHTASFLKKLNTLLHKDAVELRKAVKMGMDSAARKEEMMCDLFKVLCIAFGEPVDRFDFCYRDNDNNFHGDYNLTPQEFYRKYVGLDLEDYIPVSNEPTTNKPLGRAYTLHARGNMLGRNELFLNLPMKELKRCAIEQLKDGEPVWFSCDCLQFNGRKEGIWDIDSYDYEGLFGGVDMTMTKQERLETRDSESNHAMILIGVNLRPDGTPDRWKIENSWGPDWGREGYFVCSDKYFDEFVYQVIVHQKYLTEDQLELLDQPIELDPWVV